MTIYYENLWVVFIAWCVMGDVCCCMCDVLWKVSWIPLINWYGQRFVNNVWCDLTMCDVMCFVYCVMRDLWCVLCSVWWRRTIKLPLLFDWLGFSRKETVFSHWKSFFRVFLVYNERFITALACFMCWLISALRGFYILVDWRGHTSFCNTIWGSCWGGVESVDECHDCLHEGLHPLYPGLHFPRLAAQVVATAP